MLERWVMQLVEGTGGRNRKAKRKTVKAYRKATDDAIDAAGHIIGRDVLSALVSTGGGLAVAALAVLVSSLPTTGERCGP